MDGEEHSNKCFLPVLAVLSADAVCASLARAWAGGAIVRPCHQKKKSKHSLRGGRKDGGKRSKRMFQRDGA